MMNKLKIALAMTMGLSEPLDFLDSIPKGSTPNKYKPHVGKKQIAKALKEKAMKATNDK